MYKYIAVILLLLPCVSALTISDVAIMRNEGVVSTINPNIPQTVSVSLLTDATSGTITVDLSDLGGSRGSIRLNDCDVEGNSRRCVIEGMKISKDGTIKSWVSVGGSSTEPVESAISLTVDTKGPAITALKTDVCGNSTCYIGNGELMNITISVTDGPVLTGNFHYQIGNTIRQPSVCGPTGCRDVVRLTCRDGEILQLRVLANHQGIVSSDDAGNKFTSVGNVTRVVCDAKAPEIISVTYNGTGPGGSVAQGKRLQILAVIGESTPSRMRVGVSNLQFNVSENASAQGDCKPMGDGRQACGVSVGNLAYGTNLAVPITITDGVGFETTRSITIGQILEVANASEVPDLFMAQTTSTMPSSINRVALDLALENGFELQHMISYNLRAKESGARVLHQRILPQTCRIATANGGDPYRANPSANWSAAPALYSPLEIFNPTAGAGSANRVQGSFLSADIAVDENIVLCNISLVVAKYNKVYAQEEMETLYWPLNFRNSKLGEPGGAFIEKIEIEKAKLNGGVNRILSVATKVTSTMTHVCQIQGVMNQATNQMVALEGIALSMSFVPGMTAVSSAAGGTAGSLITLTSQTWMGDIFGGGVGKVGTALSEVQGPIQKMCHYVHCDIGEKMEEAKTGVKTPPTNPDSRSEAFFDNIEKKTTLPGSSGYLNAGSGIADKLAGLGGDGKGRMSIITDDLFSDLNTPDVSNSLMSALATGCFPAVVHNLDKYRQIDCGYLQCLKEQALNGATITPCEEARGVKMCTAVTGEFFELPYVRVFKNLAGNVNQVIQNSGFMATKLIMGTCTEADNSAPAFANPKAFACRIMKSLEYTKQFGSVTQFNQEFRPPYEQDLCSAVLCEGDSCERTSGSYAERTFFPGYVGYTWPQRQEEQRLLTVRDQASKGYQTELIAQTAPKQLELELQQIKKNYEAAAATEAGKTGLPVTSTEVETAALKTVQEQLQSWETKRVAYEKQMGEQAETQRSAKEIFDNGQKELEEFERTAAQYEPSEDDLLNLEQIVNYGRKDKIDIKKIRETYEKECLQLDVNDCIRMFRGEMAQAEPGRTEAEIGDSKENVAEYNKWSGNFKQLTSLETDGICDSTLAGVCVPESCSSSNPSCARRQQELSQLQEQLSKEGKVACSTGSDVQICIGSSCGGDCITASKREEIDIDKETRRVARNQKMKNYLEGVMDITTQYAVSQGYFDVLTLGSWGSWGAKISGTTTNVMNPEQWQSNICNPRGDLKDLTKDQSSVYLFQRGAYRPVLTFAAERMELPDGQYLYTASAVIISTEYDVNATVLLDSEELGTIPLPKDQQESRSFSIISPNYYEELCVSFTKAFPQSGSDRMYCRAVQVNAYDRGAKIAYDFEYGRENPWESEIAAEDAITATALGTLGVVAGGQQ